MAIAPNSIIRRDYNLDNLRFITWFENRAKADMSLAEWEKIKANISDYFV